MTNRPTEFVDQYEQVVLGTDTVWGGDIQPPTGKAHFIADYRVNGQPLPKVYNDPLAQELRDSGGASAREVGSDDHEKIARYVKRYDLLDMADEVAQRAQTERSPGDAGVMQRLMGNMKVMLKTALATGTWEEPMPSFEERYRSVTGEDPKLQTDRLPEIRDQLRRGLARAGFETSRSKPLPETMDAWRASRIIPEDQFATRAAETNARLLAMSRQNILGKLDFGFQGHDAHLDDVAFNGNQLELVHAQDRFTGSSAFLGGEDASGKPLLHNLFEYNLDHPMTKDELPGFAAHENFPGHYLNMAVTDLARRAGQLGQERAIGTMCSEETVFQEGWAQNALLLAHGGNVDAMREELGDGWEAAEALDELQDCAKNDASIHHQRDGMPLDQLAQVMREQYVLPPHIVKKMCGGWGRHAIVGPMYGSAYLRGKQGVAKALKEHGFQNVIETGMHRRGFVDMQRFEEEVGRSAA